MPMNDSMIFNFRRPTVVAIVTLLSLVACKKQNEQPAISVSSFTPAQGSKGDDITINGNNFSTTLNANSVSFNGITAAVVSATATSLVATVPQGATTGKISVTVGGRGGISVDDFIV